MIHAHVIDGSIDNNDSMKKQCGLYIIKCMLQLYSNYNCVCFSESPLCLPMFEFQLEVIPQLHSSIIIHPLIFCHLYSKFYTIMIMTFHVNSFFLCV